jgi:hypothetical protein
MTAKAVLAAFKSLRKADRDKVLQGMARDASVRRDLIDLAIIARRKNEPSRPLRDYLRERVGQ